MSVRPRVEDIEQDKVNGAPGKEVTEAAPIGWVKDAPGPKKVSPKAAM
jgi:hypothetical protein